MSLHVQNLSLFLSSNSSPGYADSVKNCGIRILDKITFSIDDGAALGIVGESGCGKSMTALSIMKLIPSPPLLHMEGEIRWNGRDLSQFTKKQMRKIRGEEISMIFQEPMTALNPVLRVGDQIREVLRAHFRKNSIALSVKRAPRISETQRIIELLEKVGIPSPEQCVKNYPHQLSGGMRQRVMIAMALACNPQLLIADEPTTALDVTIQAQILEQLKQLRYESQMALLFISHDLDVVGYLADRILVMYAGEIVESATTEELFASPAHPYTKALQQSRPSTVLDVQSCEDFQQVQMDKNIGGKLTPIPGNVPPLDNLPEGCRFYERCDFREARCAVQHPPFFQINSGHLARCFLHDIASRERERSL